MPLLANPSSEMRECSSLRSHDCSDEKVVCPKPQRVAVANSRSADFVKPIRHAKSMAPMAIEGTDPGCEISEIFISKTSLADLGCSPPYFSGSPPSRCANPMVKDTQFLHSHAYPTVVKTSQVKVAAGISVRGSPSVRIEGFDCSVRGFECTGRDAGRRVSAFA